MHLGSRGVDPDRVCLDDLLDRSEVEAIEARFRSGFRIEAELDRYDITAAVIAGVGAALVDFLIVRIPTGMTYAGDLQRGSPLTEWLRSFEVPPDNRLASWFKTSYDRVGGIDLDGFGPRTHRLQTFGHDPLLGLLFGTIDVLRGGLTGVSRDGVVTYVAGTGQAIENPIVAFTTVVMHMLSDVATRMGLPPPGWTLTHALQFGSFGEKDRTVAELARFMYLKGFDSRHFLTMGTSVAAAELILRAYVGLRRHFERGYDEAFVRVGEVAGAHGVGSNPRYVAMSLAAHGIAAAANAGKIAAHGGNPLAFNYALWLQFVRRLFNWITLKLRSPTDVLLGYAGSNERALLRGAWGDLGQDDFPVLV